MASVPASVARCTELGTLMRTVVVIPCLNEQATLAATCASLGFGLDGPSPDDVTLVLVDNGSDDETPAVMGSIRQSSPDRVILAKEPERSTRFAHAVSRNLRKFRRTSGSCRRLLDPSKRLSATELTRWRQMPMLKISNTTMRAVRAKRPPGYELAGTILRFDNGDWLVPVDDEAILRVAAERVRGESDDGVVARLLRD